MIENDNIFEKGCKICVVGVGGGGGNAINSMIRKGIKGVEFIVINNDLQALECNKAPKKIQIGKHITKGLGSGADPVIGKKSVNENIDEINQALTGKDMVIIVSGMGGGTGTGGTPLVANIAKSHGALVVGIVTKPFIWEGKRRQLKAEEGILELKKYVDTLIVIPNQRLLSMIDKITPMIEAFDIANQVIYDATRGITELMTINGIVNVDFADVRTVMKDMGDAVIGIGMGRGINRSVDAAQNVLSSPLLDGKSIEGAQGVLVNITSGRDVGMTEISDSVNVIHQAAGDQANIIFGAVIDERITEELYVTVIATGFNKKLKTIQDSMVGNIPYITRIPTGSGEFKNFDEPTFLRKGDRVTLDKIIENIDGFQQKIDKSNPDKPAFLRKVFDYKENKNDLKEKELANIPQNSYDNSAIFIIWDPNIVSKEDYANLVNSIGDLVRSEGGIGLIRINQDGYKIESRKVEVLV